MINLTAEKYQKMSNVKAGLHSFLNKENFCLNRGFSFNIFHLKRFQHFWCIERTLFIAGIWQILSILNVRLYAQRHSTYMSAVRKINWFLFFLVMASFQLVNENKNWHDNKRMAPIYAAIILYIFISIPLFLLVFKSSNLVVDEEFHLRQGRHYCEGNFHIVSFQKSVVFI